MSSHDPPPRDDRDDDRTRQLDAVENEGDAAGRPPLEATVDHQQHASRGSSWQTAGGPVADPGNQGTPGPPPQPDDERPPRRWGKGAALVLLGIVLGFVAAFVVVALGTEDASPTAGPSEAAMQRIQALEAEVAERDATITDLEAQLEEAGAEAGQADEAIAAQREALDSRAEELDARASALNEREQALADRERAVEEREQQLAAREQELEEGGPSDGEEPSDEGGGLDLPELDDEQVEGIVDRVLDRIRELF